VRVIAAAIILTVSAACGRAESDARQDAAFDSLQRRGEAVMGVDQYTSAHVFEELPDGGRIILERADSTDTASVRIIREHMREIAKLFAAGDFAKPFQVHARVVPGTDVMTRLRDRIAYEASDRPRGGQVRISSGDSVAVRAIHAFLAFQRMDHRASGH
jgi:hypothetical protein